MTNREKMKKGMLYFDGGEGFPEEQVKCKELVYDYNNTRPSEKERRSELLKKIFASVGSSPFVEPPMRVAYGNRIHVGDNFYANFNLVVVDDVEVYIGNNVMLAPNVTISVTGHPVDPELRRGGTQFSFPVAIEDDVWVGAGAVILPGVTIGKGSVIGAGSVVTKDVPPGVVAFGVPCKVVRPIGERDKEYYFGSRRVDEAAGDE